MVAVLLCLHLKIQENVDKTLNFVLSHLVHILLSYTSNREVVKTTEITRNIFVLLEN